MFTTFGSLAPRRHPTLMVLVHSQGGLVVGGAWTQTHQKPQGLALCSHLPSFACRVVVERVVAYHNTPNHGTSNLQMRQGCTSRQHTKHGGDVSANSNRQHQQHQQQPAEGAGVNPQHYAGVRQSPMRCTCHLSTRQPSMQANTEPGRKNRRVQPP